MTATAIHTRDHVYTRTHTATYLTDAIMGSLGTIVAELALDPRRLSDDWKTLQKGLVTWMAEESLSAVVLECMDLAGEPVAVFEFPVKYTAGGSGDAKFVLDNATLAKYRAKLKRVPPGSTYRIVAQYGTTPTELEGWSATKRLSTEGMQSRVFGTVAAAPHGAVSMRYLYRS